MQSAAASKLHENNDAEQAAGGGVCGSYKWWRLVLLSLVLLTLAEWYELFDAKVVTSALLGRDPLSRSSNISSSSDSSSGKFETQNQSHDNSHTSDPPDNRLLLKALSQTLSLVTNGRRQRMSEKERNEWDRRNPCSSRSELPLMYLDRNHSKELPRNPEWEQVLEEYAELHRACTLRVGNITDYFLNRKNSVPECKFVVADANPGAGLGNKILVLASAFAYALATQRILLVSHLNLLPAYTCEPFRGSSWFLNSSQVLLTRTQNHSWQSDDDFYRQLDAHARYWGKQNASSQLRAEAAGVERKYHNPNASFPWRPEDYAVVASPDSAHSYQAHSRFYCRGEQEYYSHVPFVLWSGCIYTIPRLFTTITFLPVFEQMFPDRMILTRILRNVVLPNNAVWRRTKHLAHAYLMRKDGARRVGIQMRFAHTGDQNLANRRVLDCLWKENILPKVAQFLPKDDDDDRQKQQQQQSLGAIKGAPVIKVFIASLLHGLYDHITKTYLENPVTVTGEDVSVVQLTSDQRQKWNSIEEDTEAFTEMLLLSFSDQLLVTPISTFGGVAQAYGALIPWFIELRPDLPDRTIPPCQRGETIDVAQQISSVFLSCSQDEISKANITVRAPYLRPVLNIELSGRYRGIHLMTNF